MGGEGRDKQKQINLIDCYISNMWESNDLV